MILSFRSKALKVFWSKGDASRIAPELAARLRRRLDALNAAKTPQDVNLPGFDFHKLRGVPPRWTVHVNGPWCVTFEWQDEDAVLVDLENYH